MMNRRASRAFSDALQAPDTTEEQEAVPAFEVDDEEARWLAEMNNEDAIASAAQIAEARAIYLQLQAKKAAADEKEAKDAAALKALFDAEELREQAEALLKQRKEKAGMDQFDAYKKKSAGKTVSA